MEARIVSEGDGKVSEWMSWTDREGEEIMYVSDKEKKK